MNENKWLAERFEENRSNLRAIAYRMLGSMSEAEDAVQETWLRLSRSDASAVENLNGWLTTVTSRICLDALRARQTRRESSLNAETPGQIQNLRLENDPEQELILADSVGLALLVVLDTLKPAERIAFVLHDLFAVPFDEIARITGRSPVAARQLASRARRRVRGVNTVRKSGSIRQREIVEAFFAAARRGDFERLLALLDADVVLRADREALPVEAPDRIVGSAAVAKTASAAGGRAEFSEVVIVNGKAGIVVAPGGRLRRALLFSIARNKIAKIKVVANRERLGKLKITALPARRLDSEPPEIG